MDMDKRVYKTPTIVNLGSVNTMTLGAIKDKNNDGGSRQGS